MAQNSANQTSVTLPTFSAISEWCGAKLARYWTHLACFLMGAILSWGGTTIWDGFAVFYLDLEGGPAALAETVNQLSELRLGEHDKMIARLEEQLDRQILEYPGIDASLQTWCPIFNPPLSLKVAAVLYGKRKHMYSPNPMMLASAYRRHYVGNGEFAIDARERLKTYPISEGYEREYSEDYEREYVEASDSAVARLARAEKFGSAKTK